MSNGLLRLLRIGMATDNRHFHRVSHICYLPPGRNTELLLIWVDLVLNLQRDCATSAPRSHFIYQH